MQRRHSYAYCNNHRQPYRLLMDGPQRIFIYAAKPGSYSDSYGDLLVDGKQCRLFPKYSITYYGKRKPNANGNSYKQRASLRHRYCNFNRNASGRCYRFLLDRPWRIYCIHRNCNSNPNSYQHILVNCKQWSSIRLQPC